MSDYATRRSFMVDTQVRPSDVTKFPIINAMLAVRREAFVPEDKREAAYMGENLPLGSNRVMMEPRSFAKLLDALDIQGDELVLDVGCGFGYSSAVIGEMAEAVVAIEDDAQWVAEAEVSLLEEGADNVVVVEAVLSEGAPKHAPFDVIILQGAAEEIPEALVAQIADGGRIGCIFSEGTLGVARIGYKLDGEVAWRYAFNAGAPVLPGFERDFEFTL